MDAGQKSDVSAWEVPTTVFNLKCYNRILTGSPGFILALFPSLPKYYSHGNLLNTQVSYCRGSTTGLLEAEGPRDFH